MVGAGFKPAPTTQTTTPSHNNRPRVREQFPSPSQGEIKSGSRVRVLGGAGHTQITNPIHHRSTQTTHHPILPMGITYGFTQNPCNSQIKWEQNECARRLSGTIPLTTDH